MIVKLDRGWEFCKEGKVFSPALTAPFKETVNSD